MTIYEQLITAVRTLREVQTEMGDNLAPNQVTFPDANQVIEEIGGMPKKSLLLGIAADGLPVLLNLNQTTTGPLLLISDRKSGKTAFLQAAAQSAGRLFSGGVMHVVVLTNFPQEWESFIKYDYMLGIWPAFEEETYHQLENLVVLVENGLAEEEYILLLIDGLDAVNEMDERAIANVNFLLNHGAQQRIWAIATLNAAMAIHQPEWLTYFKSRFFGRVAHPALGEELTSQTGAALNTLFSGAQFCIRQGSRWMRFWLPSY